LGIVHDADPTSREVEQAGQHFPAQFPQPRDSLRMREP
jgi:hypothetical protein